MTELIDYRALASTIQIEAAMIPAIIGAAEHSWARIIEARAHLRDLEDDGGVAIFALGSLGRLEASAASDLDLAILFRDPLTSKSRAEEQRRIAVMRLRGIGFEVAEKTFARAQSLDALLADIGGRMDTSDHLTYRSLVLTEGVSLHSPATSTAIREALFQAYTRGPIASGRYLSALGNDLHRYYRTICVDYRFKVEVAGKGWALRNLKLRHSRKLWHLANLVLFTWASTLADDTREAELGAHLGVPPLARIAHVLVTENAAALAGPLFIAYERFLAAIALPKLRTHLDTLPHDRRETSTTYRELKANADAFDVAAAAIVDHMLRKNRRYLIRFGLL